MHAQDDDGAAFEGTIPAPDFPTGLEWINVPAPLTFDDLRGKVVILDFWTYGCINCIHMIPILRQLEEKYPDELVVIGVHSAKFANEGETRNIRQIVQRYELEHPVINDNEFRVWRTFSPFGVNAWPTFAVIDPEGRILAVQAGEIPFAAFDRVIGGMVGHFDALGALNREPIELALEGEGQPDTALLYPGKVLADAEGNRLFIADSNHHRIVIADLTSYEVLDVIGTGAAGFADGAYGEAQFSKPQGMTLSNQDNTLYVADVENHAIRAVDLEARTVRTVAGTGEMVYQWIPGMDPRRTGLRSPWAVELAPDGMLYIAMAGPHQIWALDLNNNQIGPWIGSGREGLISSTFENTQLAQPSGLWLHDDLLYIADSESSGIRAANLATEIVETVAGPIINDLFTFGDVDGVAGESRLQHPLGVTGTPDGLVYIADTYNSRIKQLDPETLETTTLYGLDEAGFRDGDASEARFYEPGGIDYADGKLYVADTNNHAIRVIDLAADEVSTVRFPNAEALQLEGQITVAGGNLALGETMDLPAQTVAPGEGEIVLAITLPEGYKINEEAPSLGEWASDGEAIGIGEDATSVPIERPEMRIPVTLAEGESQLTGTLNIYYCEAVQETLCYLDAVSVTVPVSVSADAAASEIIVERAITPPTIEVGGL